MYNKKALTARTFFLDSFHQHFFPEVRKNLSSKGMSFKVLILDNGLGYPEPDEFNIEGIKVVYLPTDVIFLI